MDSHWAHCSNHRPRAKALGAHVYPSGAISSEPSEAVLLVVLWHAGLEAEGA